MGCGGSKPAADAEGSSRGAQGEAVPNPTAVFDTTMGSFEAEIYLDRVPITASNFIDLCQKGFYDGIHFHRVIPGFMNQFGCPHAKDPKSSRAGTGGPENGTYKNLKTGATEKRFNGGCIKDENISKDTNAIGTLSMANTGQKNSGGSQMFINVANNSNLDWFSPGASKHPVFGKITSGMDIVEAISKVKTKDDNPIEPIKMNKITINGLLGKTVALRGSPARAVSDRRERNNREEQWELLVAIEVDPNEPPWICKGNAGFADAQLAKPYHDSLVKVHRGPPRQSLMLFGDFDISDANADRPAAVLALSLSRQSNDQVGRATPAFPLQFRLAPLAPQSLKLIRPLLVPVRLRTARAGSPGDAIWHQIWKAHFGAKGGSSTIDVMLLTLRMAGAIAHRRALRGLGAQLRASRGSPPQGHAPIRRVSSGDTGTGLGEPISGEVDPPAPALSGAPLPDLSIEMEDRARRDIKRASRVAQKAGLKGKRVVHALDPLGLCFDTDILSAHPDASNYGFFKHRRREGATIAALVAAWRLRHYCHAFPASLKDMSNALASVDSLVAHDLDAPLARSAGPEMAPDFIAIDFAGTRSAQRGGGSGNVALQGQPAWLATPADSAKSAEPPPRAKGRGEGEGGGSYRNLRETVNTGGLPESQEATGKARDAQSKAPREKVQAGEQVDFESRGPPREAIFAASAKWRSAECSLGNEGKPDKGEGQGKQQQTQTETDKGLIMNAVEPFHMHGLAPKAQQSMARAAKEVLGVVQSGVELKFGHADLMNGAVVAALGPHEPELQRVFGSSSSFQGGALGGQLGISPMASPEVSVDEHVNMQGPAWTC
ncbi:unnamed protein product [Prorocentrum cordatum]|uniref:peptidylprolyl isomerase n=1 Tax=Prorocentrum cordatum TaxID=2364126 RepID=A0ABN9X9I1_9DINO|nr:unnamed protein product [Polarella glacialis]